MTYPERVAQALSGRVPILGKGKPQRHCITVDWVCPCGGENLWDLWKLPTVVTCSVCKKKYELYEPEYDGDE